MPSLAGELQGFLQQHATLVLFVCICLGYLIGGIQVRKFRLGGVCGTLLVALVLGQAGVVVAPGASQVAFALFIFSLGYLAGPQFVASFHRSDIRLLIFPIITLVLATAVTFASSVILGLSPGTTGGLFAGGTSQSAALGTASEALNHIGLTPGLLAAQQTDLASAYSLSYLCALVTVVAFSTQLAPAWMKVDLAADARAVLRRLSSTHPASSREPRQGARPDLAERAYHVGHQSPSVTVADLKERLGSDIRVSGVMRSGEVLASDPDLRLLPSDLIQVVGSPTNLATRICSLGDETDVEPLLASRSDTVDVMLTRRALSTSLPRLRDLISGSEQVAVTGAQRAGRPLSGSELDDVRAGDVVTLRGPVEDLQPTAQAFGKPIDPTVHADWAYLGAGIVVGMLIGLLDLQWGPFAMTIGTGGGVLIAGLVFGWLRMRRATVGAYAPTAANVIKDLGLTIFIGVTGLTGAPRIVPMIKEFGLGLPLAAVLVCLIPAAVSLLVARRALRLSSPLALGAVVGQQCSTPALTLLQQRAGNDAPLITFVKVYAMANVLLPLVAPLVVGISAALQT